MKDQNLNNVLARQQRYQDGSKAEFDVRTLETIMKDNPEAAAIANQYSKDTLGIDINELLSPTDPSGFGLELAERQRRANQFFRYAESKISSSGSGGTLPEWKQDILDQTAAMERNFQRLSTDYIKENGEPTTFEEKWNMVQNVNKRMPRFSLEQNLNHSRWLDDLTTRMNGGEPIPWADDINLSREEAIDWITGPIQHYGVVPRSLGVYLQGALNNIESLGDEELARVLDLARALNDGMATGAGGKFDANSALGSHGPTLRAIFDKVPDEDVQANALVRQMFEKAAKGIPLFGDRGDPEVQELITDINNELDGGFEELFSGITPNPHDRFITNQIEVPQELRDEAFDAILALRGKYDWGTAKQRNKLMQEGIQKTIESGKWYPSEYGFSDVRGNQPLTFRMGGFLIGDDPNPLDMSFGIGTALQSIGMDKAWAKDAPEQNYPGPHMEVVKRAINKRLKDIPEATGENSFRLGDNAYMEKNYDATNADPSSSPQWNIWLRHEDGTFSLASEEFGGVLTMGFEKEIKTYEAEQYRVKTINNDINDNMRLLSRLEQEKNTQAFGDPRGLLPNPEREKEITRLRNEIEKLKKKRDGR
jgi:hypothetical protein